MNRKRVAWIGVSLFLVIIANFFDKSKTIYTANTFVNSDLVILTISSLNQTDENMNQYTHDGNCYK